MSWTRIGERRTLGALDANAATPTRRVPGATYALSTRNRQEKPVKTVRPPRPMQVDPETLAEAARALGMKQTEITAVRDTDEGRLVTTLDGSVTIIVPSGRPDAFGQTGALLYAMPDGRPAPKGARIYARGPASAEITHSAEPWTVADLDLVASRERIPAPLGTADPFGQWLAADPAPGVRARALWLKIARDNGLTPAAATMRFAEAARMQGIVLGSGLLAETEEDKL